MIKCPHTPGERNLLKRCQRSYPVKESGHMSIRISPPGFWEFKGTTVSRGPIKAKNGFKSPKIGGKLLTGVNKKIGWNKKEG